ncbi:MAG: trehalose-6-phosphate synthase [Candidatus Melainabacteria bacterium]|nr:trehalose-6-phosphate synthase [Candidatus Melainabacteria bacterium]
MNSASVVPCNQTPTAPTTDKALNRLVIVSNREPYSIQTNGQEVWLEKTPGGLVSALDPVLRERNGLWICWEGAPKKVAEFDDVSTLENDIDLDNLDLPYEIQTVSLTEAEINHYYYGYANTRIWPLFHYFVSRCNFFDERDWPNYQSANQKFADAIVAHTTAQDWIWVQDYHLLLVPEMVRAEAPERNLGFFLHIPFPALEVFKVLPRREVILRGMLGSDLIGFHVPEYVKYFLDAVEALIPTSEAQVDREQHKIVYHGRTIQVRAFPISIDCQQIEQLALSETMQEKAWALRDQYTVERIGLSVDRLDYTKGILENLEALDVFFEKYPDYKKRFSFIQIAAPTRTEVPEYQKLKEEIDQAVGRINGKHAQDNWVPIHYFYRSFPLQEVLPYFMIADVAMVTPLRDGMNLVVKEYCAAKVDLGGVLMLSEFTGAASELKEALQINPFHIEQMADTLYSALHLPPEVRESKMRALRKHIQQNNIQHWVRSYMEAFANVLHHS